ncbi:hypothetical protein M0812_16318 [Anaeramoeba flamelloides]|uniref:Uncharacterized protein n=1 Tax=Anaeramoeba flamelloides TaxID=1746091 RepID=A0AAV7ZE25_9EUKA|nr:hypothetical protein M0812_16318 [Anaeramoeba flamelloides]
MDNYSQFERNLPKNKLYKYPKNDEYNNRERRVNYQNNDYQQFSREDHRSFDYNNNNHYPKFEDEDNHNNIYFSYCEMHPSLYQKEISPDNRGGGGISKKNRERLF